MSTFRTKTLTNTNNFYIFFNGDPIAFNGMYLSCISLPASICGDEDIWEQHEMPLSREKLAQLVLQAENDVASVLGTFVKPKWVTEEIEVPTSWHGRTKLGIPLADITFKTKHRYIRRFGQQDLKKIVEAVALTYVDRDGDGYDEVATFSFTLPEDSNLCDIKLYFPNTTYEIGTANVISYDVETRVANYEIDSWLLVKPELYINRKFAKTETAIDACDSDNFVLTIDIWEDALDTCKPAVEFVYDEHTCTTNCRENRQPGCAKILDKCEGKFKVSAQRYDDDGCVADGVTCAVCSVPKKIIVHYQAGCHSDSCLPGQCDTDCFCNELEWIVFKLAASNLPYPTCDCGCIQSVLRTMQQETSLVVKREERVLNYPGWMKNEAIFGTSVGKIEAAIDLLRVAEKFCNY